MNEADFAVLCGIKERLEQDERASPMSRAAKRRHRDAWRDLCKLRGALNLTEEQFKILATPQGGGTPKTPPEDE
jgi:hypothetical protein